MAIMNKFCCCSLRIGVLIIAGVSFAISCYGIYNGAIVINTSIPRLRKLIKEYPDQVEDAAKTYGFRINIIDDVAVMAKIALALNAISLIAAVLLAVPALFTDPDRAKTLRFLLLIWVAWKVMDVFWSIGYAGWIFAKFTKLAVSLILILAANVLLAIYFILAIISHFLELGVNSQTPSVTVTPQANLSLGQMECGATAPPPYIEKTTLPYSKPQVYC